MTINLEAPTSLTEGSILHGRKEGKFDSLRGRYDHDRTYSPFCVLLQVFALALCEVKTPFHQNGCQAHRLVDENPSRCGLIMGLVVRCVTPTRRHFAVCFPLRMCPMPTLSVAYMCWTHRIERTASSRVKMQQKVINHDLQTCVARLRKAQANMSSGTDNVEILRAIVRTVSLLYPIGRQGGTDRERSVCWSPCDWLVLNCVLLNRKLCKVLTRLS